MIWKVIGQSVIGTSHTASGKGCEDACRYAITGSDNATLIFFISDGAGSASHAADAATLCVEAAVDFAAQHSGGNETLDDEFLFRLAESLYDQLEHKATQLQVPRNEFSCTLLGGILYPDKAGFLQIGDGAIIRNDGNGHFTHIFWPHNGEYQNSTSFLIDDPNLSQLKTRIIDGSINEIAVFSDGLQLLALNNESETVHQPFFTSLFHPLRKAVDEEHIAILNKRLSEYLSGTTINSRTDDDKTLLLATRV